MPSFPLKYFLLGACGSLIPEVFRLVTLARERKTFPFTAFYVVMSVLFACAAGLLAAYLPSANERTALYAGISAPVLINTATKRYRATTRKKKAVKASNMALIAATSRFDRFIEGL